MKEKNIEGLWSKSLFPGAGRLGREKVPWVQELLEEEVTELLGRDKSERRGKVDPASGYRNGYGKARRLTLSSGTITVRRPRVRDLEERFESRVVCQTDAASPRPDSRGAWPGSGRFRPLRGLLGEEAALSANT